MRTSEQIVAWLQDYVRRAGARGYVVGLSGGIDSACTAALCRQAAGSQLLTAWLPCYSLPEDETMARLVATAFDLEMVTVDLGPVYDALLAAQPEPLSEMARANIKARLRMVAWHALGQTRGYLVAGTGNKTEIAIGYFTKYGDAGVDVEPLGNLYKWQVRQLARELGVPQPVIERPPSAGLWAGQTDEGEIGITYDDLDATLAAIESGKTEAVEPRLLQRVLRLTAKSAHKRAMPPVCPIYS